MSCNCTTPGPERTVSRESLRYSLTWMKPPRANSINILGSCVGFVTCYPSIRETNWLFSSTCNWWKAYLHHSFSCSMRWTQEHSCFCPTGWPCSVLRTVGGHACVRGPTAGKSASTSRRTETNRCGGIWIFRLLRVIIRTPVPRQLGVIWWIGLG